MKCIAAFAFMLVCSSVGVRAASPDAGWLGGLPNEFALEYLPGVSRVNGVALQLAVAHTTLSQMAARAVVVASWAGADDPLGSHSIAGTTVISRRVGRWHDTASLRAEPYGGTRITFSRIDLRKRAHRAKCTIALPRSFSLLAVTQSSLGPRDVMQCTFASRLAPQAAVPLLESEWLRQGWQQTADGLWSRRGLTFRAVTVAGSQGALVFILGEPVDTR